METYYKVTAERSVTFVLNGKVGEEAIPDLQQSISEARQADRHVYIDLSEVTLMDRKAVQYFSEQAERDVTLVNCPIYLKHWIRRGER